jgi:integrase
MQASLNFHRKGLPIAEFRNSWAWACCAAGIGKLVCPHCSGDVDEKRTCAQCSATWRREELRYVGRLFHDLRRSAVRDLIRAGVSAHVAMSISGHKTDSMLRRYDIVDTRDQRAALERRAEYLKTVRGEGVIPRPAWDAGLFFLACQSNAQI